MSTMRAIVIAGPSQASVKDDVPVPKPDAHEVLVRVTAVTLNPTDWKHIKYLSKPGTISGCDFVGVVEQVASSPRPDAPKLKKGDKVAGCVHGGYYTDRGSFAQFLKTAQESVIHIPDGIEDGVASSTGVGGFTTAQALFDKNRLGLPLPPADIKQLPELTSSSQKLLVWSGATSVGQFAIQVGRAAGLYVLTTASPKNHALLKELGASETYDYKEEGLPEKIAEKHPDLAHALDCISEHGTQSLAARSLGTKGGKVVVLLKPEAEAVKLRPDVKIIHTLAYSIMGVPFQYGPAVFTQEQVSADKAAVQPFLGDGIYRSLYSAGLLRGNRIKHMDGGLDGILDGLKLLEEGKVSAEKLTYTIA